MARSYKTGTATYVPAKRRKGFLAIALPWLKRFGLILGALIFIAWLGAWLVVTGSVSRAMDWSRAQIIGATASAGFTVENLLVEGRVHTDPVLLKAILNIQTGDPLFGVSPRDAQALLEDTKWIRRAHIQRRLPDTLYIKLQERTPIALWTHDGKTALLDEDGAPISVDDLSPFKGLIALKGKAANDAAAHLITALAAEPIIATHIVSATRYGARRWDLTLQNGITLKMPEDDLLSRALSRAADAQINDKILDSEDLESLDLRFDDKIIIRTKPGAVIDYRKGLGDNRAEHNQQGSA